MFALALTVALSTSSGGLLAESRVEARHARLIESPAAMVGGALLGNKPVDLMSLPELEARRMELEDSRRSLVGPIVVLSLGGVAAVTGLILVSTYSVVVVIVGALVLVAATVLIIVGIATLVGTIVRNGKTNRQLDALDARISQLRGGGAPPPSSYDDAPPPPPGDEPPPPPPPSSQHLAPVAPTLVLASF